MLENLGEELKGFRQQSPGAYAEAIVILLV